MSSMTNKSIKKQIEAWSDYIKQHEATGKRIYFLSVMFKTMGGNENTMKRNMIDEINRIYAILVTRMVRKPRAESASDKLPIFLFCLERPVLKRKAKAYGDSRINDGLHGHILAIMPKKSRLGYGLRKHFRVDKKLYLRGCSKLARIHALRVKTKVEDITDYTLKGLKRSRNTDDWNLLGKSRSELCRTKTRGRSSRARHGSGCCRKFRR